MTGQDAAAAIKKSPFFSELSPELVDGLAGGASFRQYRAGQRIFQQGDPGGGLYLVAKGKIKVFVTATGDREQLIDMLEPGEILGEETLFSEREQGHSSGAQAVGQVSIIFFPRRRLQPLIAANPDLAAGFLRRLSGRIIWLNRLLETRTFREVPARLAFFLLGQAEKNTRFRLAMTKGQMASFLGASPETVSRAFSRLKSQGAISEEKPFIIIIDKARLEGLVCGSGSAAD